MAVVPQKIAAASLPLLFALIAIACNRSASELPSHQIELQSVATLTGVADSIDLGTGMPRVTSSGMIVALLDHPPSGVVGIFDSTGRFLKRIGRSGGGPGEFRDVRSVGIGPGDSIWVVDQLFRAHLFAPPPSAAYARAISFKRANSGGITPSGILSAGVYTSNGIVPAHLVDWEGTLVREYGASAPTADIHDRPGHPSLRDSMHAWVPYANTYVLELLGADGNVHQRIERELSWFAPDSVARARKQNRPRPRIHAVNTGSDGFLWVLIRRVARSQWWSPRLSSARSSV